MDEEVGMIRESSRVKDANKNKVLDDSTRNRRVRLAVANLEKDNYQQDPHANIVLNKNAPKFLDTIEPKSGRNKKEKSAEYYKHKFGRTFDQLVEADQYSNPDGPNYMSIMAPPSKLPARKFCAVCGFKSTYKCLTCGARYCSVLCLDKHKTTSCLKWTA